MVRRTRLCIRATLVIPIPGSEGQTLTVGQKYYWVAAAYTDTTSPGDFVAAWDTNDPNSYSFQVATPTSPGNPVTPTGSVVGSVAGGHAWGWKPLVQGVSLPVSPISSKLAYHFTRTLKLGMKGDDVVVLQKFLKITPVASKAFGPKTKSALVNYQKLHKLTADGVAGPKTRMVIESEMK